MIRISRSTSDSVSALVGSSMMTMSDCSERALAISTSCWSPTQLVGELRVGDQQLVDKLRRRRPAFQFSEQPRRRSVHRPLVQQPEAAAPLAAQENVGGHSQLLDQVQLLV